MMCVHCGRDAVGYATIEGDRYCHPNRHSRLPDCYRRVSVYHEEPGVLKNEVLLPYGVEEIRSRVYRS